MKQFLSYLIFNNYSLIGLSVLFLLLLIQTYFYIFYYRKTTPNQQNNNEKNRPNSSEYPSVSVIIIAKNESENLINNLPSVLSQEYPNFEVIVVNDGSTDESYYFLENLSKEDPRLYHTFSPISDDYESNRRKILPMTIGIKAARNEILLFTEASSKPISNHWISSMVNNLANKDIVLGYSFFDLKQSFWGKVAQFDNLIFSLQYLSMAIKNKPYIGTYRNIAYRKHLFFDNKGFSSTLSYPNAEEIFLNRIMTNDNTSISINKESYIETKIENFTNWKNLKMIYLNAKSHFIKFTPKCFFFETFSRYLFLIIGITNVVYSSLEGLWAVFTISIIMFVIKYILQFSILKKASTQFETSINYLLLPILNFVQPIYNLNFLRSSQKKRKKKRK